MKGINHYDTSEVLKALSHTQYSLKATKILCLPAVKRVYSVFISSDIL